MVILRRKNRGIIAKETYIRREIKTLEVQRRIGASTCAKNTDRAMTLLGRIEKVKGRVSDITRSLEESHICFFNCSLLKLAKRVVEAIQELDILLDETTHMENELSPLVGNATVERNVDAVLRSLRDPLIGKVGVYAMAGSGKTATIKYIHNHLLNTKDFDEIIWVTISDDFNLYRVQRNIAEQLNMDLSSYADEDHRAARLSNKLNQTNKLLILRHNPLSQPLSYFFFSQMPALQVLDLSYTGITELPSSFSDLLNLRALFLQHWGALEKIPSVAKLQKLWMVDLSYTSIKQVPHGLEELSSLTSLSLAGCKSLEKIPSLVKLQKLQQFD